MIKRQSFKTEIDGDNAIVLIYTKNDVHHVEVMICTPSWSPDDYYREKSSIDEIVMKGHVSSKYDKDITIIP